MALLVFALALAAGVRLYALGLWVGFFAQVWRDGLAKACRALMRRPVMPIVLALVQADAAAPLFLHHDERM